MSHERLTSHELLMLFELMPPVWLMTYWPSRFGAPRCCCIPAVISRVIRMVLGLCCLMETDAGFNRGRLNLMFDLRRDGLNI